MCSRLLLSIILIACFVIDPGVSLFGQGAGRSQRAGVGQPRGKYADGHNDVLRAMPIGVKDFRFFRVFSRWGQMVFQTADPSVGWNGLYNGQQQPSDTFVWVAE